MLDVHFRLIVSYDGTRFFGFQHQNDEPTIQGEIERALERIVKSKVRIKSAGRTDAGVHAIGQVISFSAQTRMTPEEMTRAINSNLSNDIKVIKSDYMSLDFDPRRSAIRRHYRYLIVHTNLPVYRNYAFYLKSDLDVKTIKGVYSYLYELDDFTSLCVGEERDKRAKIERIKVGHYGDFIAFDISAPFFLRKMVRMTVRLLIEVGLGRISVDEVPNILKSKDPSILVPLPPNGLYLIKVDYPDGFSHDVGSIFNVPFDI
ncbi:MAG: tRNA pseudouridine(38-40) synthase TruA [bacterium]